MNLDRPATFCSVLYFNGIFRHRKFTISFRFRFQVVVYIQLVTADLPRYQVLLIAIERTAKIKKKDLAGGIACARKRDYPAP